MLRHRTFYLLGTEAPDNAQIPAECGAPNTGYDDRSRGHSVDWSGDYSEMIKDGAAGRAGEECDKTVEAHGQGDMAATAYCLGAMAHYVGHSSQFGHAMPFEEHHSDYESWVGRRTDSPKDRVFESYLTLAALSDVSLIRRQ